MTLSTSRKVGFLTAVSREKSVLSVTVTKVEQLSVDCDFGKPSIRSVTGVDEHGMKSRGVWSRRVETQCNAGHCRDLAGFKAV